MGRGNVSQRGWPDISLRSPLPRVQWHGGGKYSETDGAALHPIGQELRRRIVEADSMTTWHKRDWKQYYELARRPWQRHRPPRPVYPSGFNRVLPAAGFSLSELEDAGVDLS